MRAPERTAAPPAPSAPSAPSGASASLDGRPSVGAPLVLRSEDLLQSTADVGALSDYNAYSHAYPSYSSYSPPLAERAAQSAPAPMSSLSSMTSMLPVAPRGHGQPGGLPAPAADVRHVDGIQAANEDLAGCRMQ